ncbi:response regulator transcription factor [Candidatus Woesearchaeota archaeon]|nr:response regulator transcription factor [Candidatus Woesearchaeota archaeon]
MVVVIAVTDLYFQAKIIEVAQQARGDIVLASTQDAVLEQTRELEPSHVIIDLDEKAFDAIDTIKQLKEQNASVHIVGFVSHVQRDLQARAKLAGCDDILARSAFFTNLAGLLQ